ncbi:MAG: 2-oxoacid:ferredoxin oxidoreductase subunit beta [Chloroflexi bacterium]|jgi:2-oxoglutarate/2-oxoacid ferredoxin oxidoreductase subunit beta|nr:2-oxoacid:ferredoxin oxidoreductase subunit beta [Chloroflexota bacterium]MBT4074282.1 2-oxoacid:ferredoxin oxidoreductase subunit beta [Chloroflexota bacterium]MBT4513474.1 2-oxoacid:ferredoxin oxidoreductase subunit beta [Chloroflexota bacterium]MBT5319371.1 2-oxoacid:ferredoxin oxidoreductase subunit beta [Chloroflexota bacterium]MBT6680968.1 2-oxoacid:ferredoxin oxidoreductase subunit beta [Chloroflexota bacterium]
MSDRNAEYDFKWCPGCGDFGVKRALEWAMQTYSEETETPMADTVMVAGIGCSGNMVHLVEGEQPFGIHGIHGRTLPVAFGVKQARPQTNTIIVAGDGDFLSIGAEHIGPAAQRNVDMTCVIMDNGVYGLTKGQASPTTIFGTQTSSTPFGKLEAAVKPFEQYLAHGVSFIGSHYSSRPRDLAKLIGEAMNHKGFSIVHVQSPCTTYNDTFDLLKGNKKAGIAPLVYAIPEDHDPSDKEQAEKLARAPGVPLGVIYKEDRPTLEDRQAEVRVKARSRTPQEMLDTYAV